MKKLFLNICFIGLVGGVFAQQNIDPNGFNRFYHANGKVASEGMMEDGKPNGYWKTFNENGILISEGNRKNFVIDSLWKFYDDQNKLLMEISYSEGKKNGLRKIYGENERVEEHYVNDVREGWTTIYFFNHEKKSEVNFINGKEEGVGREFAEDGRVITLSRYRKGFVVDREVINRLDHQGRKQGLWKYFFDDYVVQQEGTYRNNLRNGYFKSYGPDGNLIEIKKFIDDKEVFDAPELTELDVVRDYYANGNVKTVGSYKNGVPEGIRREYSQDGNLVASYIYSGGKVIGEGLISSEGVKDGAWKEYYVEGQLRSEGFYDKGKPVGKWKFYHQNGRLEQEGEYNAKGLYQGEWKWYYSSGTIWREEAYIDGTPDGFTTEYDSEGTIILQGEYLDGLEEGQWIFQYGDHREEGEYQNGLRNGLWKYFFPNGQIHFEGSYIDGNNNGKHTWYWESGRKKEEVRYIMGQPDGDWIKYNKDGTPFVVVQYQNGIEKKYDGIKIKPAF